MHGSVRYDTVVQKEINAIEISLIFNFFLFIKTFFFFYFAK